MTTYFMRTTSPLAVKLACSVACLWTSFASESETRLPKNETELMLNLIVPLLSSRHNSVLVQHSLLYLTLARDGLTSAEMVDILSLDDDVSVSPSPQLNGLA